MARMAAVIFLVVLIGCGGSLEDAPMNFQNGNEFYNRGQYEVAEYYYEKIPEESPLYPEAKKKLDAITEIKKDWVNKEISSSDIEKVVIVDNKAQIDNTTHIPSHRLVIANNTSRELESVAIRFTYYDAEGDRVGQLTTVVKTPLEPHSQKVFGGVKPGIMTHAFSSSDAEIVSAKHK